MASQQSGAVPPEPPSKPPEPPQKLGKPEAPLSKADAKYAFLLKSPFAKMFAKTGQMPTVKEMKAIMDGILKQAINQIKRDDANWRKAEERMKRVIEGKE